MSINIINYLKRTIEIGASDLHVTVGHYISMRIDGKLEIVGDKKARLVITHANCIEDADYLKERINKDFPNIEIEKGFSFQKNNNEYLFFPVSIVFQSKKRKTAKSGRCTELSKLYLSR